MKLTGARIQRFIAAPDAAIRAVLVFGEDEGLVRERAKRIAQSIVPDLADPFRVAEFPADALKADPVRLDDETRALSLAGGRRVVRVRGADDAQAGLFERFFAAPPPGDTLVVVESADLGGKSQLRRVFEAAKDGAAIQCRPDGADELAALVDGVMTAHRVKLDRDAKAYLVAHLSGDRLLNRGELEKLALYAGDGGTVSYDETRAVVGDSAEITLDDVVAAAATGNLAALERSLGRAFEEGESPITVLRAGLRHFQRLYAAAARIAAGSTADDALAGLRPPVFFAMREPFLAQLRLWSKSRAAAALETLFAAERNAKRTGIPPEAVACEALTRVARGARRQR
ncbi:MAG TPA: DNA polymerase III subunit delta [Stellaceae bacterium]|nr:DNA polymerase III subunit delta [Stellaceae bacterium]